MLSIRPYGAGREGEGISVDVLGKLPRGRGHDVLVTRITAYGPSSIMHCTETERITRMILQYNIS